MGHRHVQAIGVAALAGVLLAATSCVPAPVREAAQVKRAAERAIVAAMPLLQRLQLTVPTAASAAPTLTLPAPTTVVAGALAAPAFEAAARSQGDQARALECLTTAVYHEARSEGADGQRAVAQVVLNRVRDRAFPASVCGVVFQGSRRATGCQFSFTCDGSMRRRVEPAAWERARAVAAAALSGEVYAPVGSATHFHTDYVSPWWAPSLARIGAVGTHIFYRWRGALERALTFRQAYAGAEPGLRAGGAAVGVAVAAAVTRAAPTEGGVTVHRGIVAIAEATPTVTAAAAPPRALTVSAGVRVHRAGRSAPATEAWSGSFTIDDATIGAEDGPA